MKTVLITGDSWFTDIDQIMGGMEYLYKVGALPDKFKVITTGAEGVEKVSEPIMLEAGFDVTHYNELPEDIDIIIVFLSDTEERAFNIKMNQWNKHKPVYPFFVGKP